MPKYVFAYHGGSMPDDPAEQQRIMGQWESWFGTMGDAVVDGGNPVAAVRVVNADGSVTDGAEGAISGYSLITADDFDGALSHAKGCPILEGGGSVEVGEAIEM